MHSAVDSILRAHSHVGLATTARRTPRGRDCATRSIHSIKSPRKFAAQFRSSRVPASWNFRFAGPLLCCTVMALSAEDSSAATTESNTALVLYTPSPHHGLHARTVAYDFEAFNMTVSLEQRYGEEGVGVGGAMWPAGAVLAEYLSRRPQIDGAPFDWNDKRVCELGAGLGLVSIIAAHLGAKVTATDGVEKVLPVLRDNIAAHTSAESPVRHAVRTMLLSWGEESHHAMVEEGVDVILAADVVYGDKVHVWRKLIRTLDALCSDTTLVLFAHFSRYPEREAQFFRLLDKKFDRGQVDPSELRPGSERTSVYVLRKKPLADGEACLDSDDERE
mmetsp:Transcript_18501/g.40476  ORF Transcript_18501/g.40476 Transcript_18501/m.40476 type:complete len:333 (+) Transcript_18501:120-1118(+)